MIAYAALALAQAKAKTNMNAPPSDASDALVTLDTIRRYCLSIRRIPLMVVSTHTLGSALPGDEICEVEVCDPSKAQRIINIPSNSAVFRIDGGRVFRRFVRRVTVPGHAGYWMCKQVTNTSSSVTWDVTTDNLAPTLEESVQKFLASIS